MRPYNELAEELRSGKSVRHNREVITKLDRLGEVVNAAQQSETMVAQTEATTATKKPRPNTSQTPNSQTAPNANTANTTNTGTNENNGTALPSDLPGRAALLKAGITTLEAVPTNQAELEAIPGISKATAEAILAGPK